MNNSRSVGWKSFFRGDNAVLAFLALAKLAVHLAANLFGGYGFFRDG